MIARHAINTSEFPANHDSAIWLESHREHGSIRAAARGKYRVEHTIGSEPGDVIAVSAINGSKFAANEHHAVALQRDAPNRPICAEPWIECIVQRAITIKS